MTSPSPAVELLASNVRWPILRLGQIGRFATSGIDKITVEGETPVQMVNYTDVYGNVDGRIDQRTAFMETTTSAEKSVQHALRPGDVLFTPSSETADDIGWAAVITEPLAGTVYSYHLTRWRPEVDLDVNFTRYAMNSRLVRAQLTSAARGTTRQILTRDDFRSVQIAVPPIHIQRAIAACLDAETGHIDTLVAYRKRMVSLLEARYLEKVRRSVTGGMPLPDPLGVRRRDITDGRWTPVKLATDLQFGSGTTPTAGEERYYGPGYPWIVTANLRDGPILEAAGSVTAEALRQFSALKIHPIGSLVVAMYGATVGRLGITTFPATFNQACCVMHTGWRIDIAFLFYYLLSHRSVLVERAVGAGQPNVSQEILRSLRVPVPSRSDQAQIATELRRLGSETQEAIGRLLEQTTLLEERRQALVTAAVTGQLGVAA